MQGQPFGPLRYRYARKNVGSRSDRAISWRLENFWGAKDAIFPLSPLLPRQARQSPWSNLGGGAGNEEAQL